MDDDEAWLLPLARRAFVTTQREIAVESSSSLVVPCVAALLKCPLVWTHVQPHRVQCVGCEAPLTTALAQQQWQYATGAADKPVVPSARLCELVRQGSSVAATVAAAVRTVEAEQVKHRQLRVGVAEFVPLSKLVVAHKRDGVPVVLRGASAVGDTVDGVVVEVTMCHCDFLLY